MKHLSSVAVFGAIAATASAQSFDFPLDPSASTTNLSANVDVALPGTATGDYDATANPRGTITCPGLFGNCANVALAMDTHLIADSDFVGVPSGGFRATIDTAGGVILLSDLSVDALGGQAGTTNLTVSLLYSTFHTFRPTSLYPSLGSAVSIPLGQATASNVRFDQTGSAVPGVLSPTATTDVYDISALVPTSLSFDVEFLGQTMTLGPIPFALPLIGSLDVSGAQPIVALTVAQAGMQALDDPFGAQTITDLPLDLPTILPPGDTAHLLFDLDPDDVVLDFAANLAWFSSGVPACDAQSYCVTTPNTFGAGAHISSTGSSSLLFNDLTLTCDGVPPFHPGRIAMGSKQTMSVLGDGVLCVGGTMRRFKVVIPDALGNVSFPIDYTDPTQPAGLITAGSTWNFQLVYRDPLGAAATFNTSDAVSVTFCP